MSLIGPGFEPIPYPVTNRCFTCYATDAGLDLGHRCRINGKTTMLSTFLLVKNNETYHKKYYLLNNLHFLHVTIQEVVSVCLCNSPSLHFLFPPPFPLPFSVTPSQFSSLSIFSHHSYLPLPIITFLLPIFPYQPRSASLIKNKDDNIHKNEA